MKGSLRIDLRGRREDKSTLSRKGEHQRADLHSETNLIDKEVTLGKISINLNIKEVTDLTIPGEETTTEGRETPQESEPQEASSNLHPKTNPLERETSRSKATVKSTEMVILGEVVVPINAETSLYKAASEREDLTGRSLSNTKEENSMTGIETGRDWTEKDKRDKNGTKEKGVKGATKRITDD